MRLRCRVAALLGALVSSSLGLARETPRIDDATAPIPPSRDPWYSAPPGFESHPNGAILRVRRASDNIASIVNNTVGTYQILYRSTDAQYKPSWAVTTVFFPSEANRSARNRRELLSYHIPYNAVNVDQSPSYLLPALGSDVSLVTWEALDRGWVVSIPDFEGPLAAFTTGISEGYAVIDSVRAVLSFDKFQGRGAARTALWGYSGGALASNWAAELQASYAPELDIAGVALGGLPSNFTQIIYNITSTPVAAIGPYSLLGITAQYPEARAYLVDNLRQEGPYNATTFLSALNTTSAEAIAAFAGHDVFGYFLAGEGILRAPKMIRVVGNNWFMGYHGIPQMPLFVYKAIGDDQTSIGATDEHIHRLCGVGANILYQRNTIGAHQDEFSNGLPRVLQWLGQVLEGSRPEPPVGCKVENVTISV